MSRSSRDRLGGVDADAQVRTVVEPLACTRTFSARSLLITQRSRPRAGSGGAVGFLGRRRRDVAEALASSTRSLQQQIDVVEQEPAALLGLTRRADAPPSARSAACARIHGLRSTPRPTRTPRHAARAQPLDDLLGLDAVAAAEHRNADARGHALDQIPVGRCPCRTAPPCGRARSTAAAPASSTQPRQLAAR